MATYEGMKFVWLSAQPADPAAPTVAEVAAGVDISAYVTRDGYAPNVTQNQVDKASIADIFDAQAQGSYGASLSLTFFMERAGGTLAYDTFKVPGVTGAMVVGRNGSVAATEDVIVFSEAESGQPEFPNSAANEEQKCTVSFALEVAPNWDAAVTA